MVERVKKLVEEGLRGDDLVATFVYRRVLPLQERAHKMCFMIGLRDPTRISTFSLDKTRVWQRCRAIAEFKGTTDWTFGVIPYRRSDPAPR